MTLLVAFALVLATVFAGVRPCALGLRRWAFWSKTETIFLVQMLLVTLAVFAFTAAKQIHQALSSSHPWLIAVAIFFPQMLWGFYQELLYRGFVQTALIRRWGAPAGLVVSNLIFAFGPLHSYHYALARHHPAHLWIFAGIFFIGLFFAVLYRYSGNLWIVALLHGVGDFFIDGLNLVATVAP